MLFFFFQFIIIALNCHILYSRSSDGILTMHSTLSPFAQSWGMSLQSHVKLCRSNNISYSGWEPEVTTVTNKSPSITIKVIEVCMKLVVSCMWMRISAANDSFQQWINYIYIPLILRIMEKKIAPNTTIVSAEPGHHTHVSSCTRSASSVTSVIITCCVCDSFGNGTLVPNHSCLFSVAAVNRLFVTQRLNRFNRWMRDAY